MVVFKVSADSSVELPAFENMFGFIWIDPKTHHIKCTHLPGFDAVSSVSGASVGFKVSADPSVELPAFENRFGNETWKPNPCE